MNFSEYFLQYGTRYAAIVGMASAFCLSSCGEKEAETQQPEQPAPAAVEPAPAAAEAPPAPEVEAPQEKETDKLTEMKEALFNFAVYTLGQQVTSPEAFPELNSTVKDMLELLHNYYAELQKGEPSLERARLAVQIAGTTRNLGAFTKAQGEYEAAYKEIESLPEDVKNSAEAQRLLSSCHNGLGVCLLAQNNVSDALAKYEAALAVDEAQYAAVAPKEGENLPEGEVAPEISRAATDLLDSYRCLGDCQRAMDDPEEARTTYMKGQELVQRLKRLSSDMSISYVKLLTALGNLDNSMGKSKEALNSWLMAAKICQSLNGSSPKLDVKAETKRCFELLLPAIQSVSQKLQAEEQENQKKAEEEKAAAEKAAAEAKAAEEAAAKRLEEEQKAAAEKEAAEKSAQEAANKRVRKSRRKK